MKRMKSMFKQILSLVLTCIMLVQVVPLSVFAADETSGSCGPNLTWRLDGDTLYIEGYGPMYDYGVVYDEEGNWVVDDEGHAIENPTPWYKGDYTRIVLDDRITHIGKAAFGREYIDNYYSGFSLEGIELPSKLESIGDYAFCTIFGVEEIVLPEGLKEMGVGVFANCEDLKSVTIPSTLKVIPESAFEMCFQLENVTIAEGVEEIGVAAFRQCNDAWNSSNYENFAAIPGIKRIEIPGSVKKIGDAAFFGDVTLTELVLNEGLEEIGHWAFRGCNYLHSVTIPSTVKTIGVEAFTGEAADMYLGDNSFLEKNPKGPVNLYVLSKDVGLYLPLPDWVIEDGLEEEYERELWLSPSVTVHAYADSLIAQEIEAYNAEIPEEGIEEGYDEEGNWVEAKYRITFYPITDDDHSFSDWTSQDLYYHSRTCADCGLEEKRYHTLVIDMYNYTIKTCEKSESYRWICTECDFISEFFTDPEWASNGHALYTGEYGQHPDYHTTWCTNCYEDLKFPHEWAYAHDPNATEPYEVDAVCSVCGYTDTITVTPDGMTVISVKAQDENGDNVTLPEDAYTVVWQDREGNLLGEGNQYTHTQDWEVTFSNPVIAVLTFSKEIRQAYSVGEKIEHTVTKLGENTEYVLTPRDTLTITGKVSPLVGGTKVTLTTVLAGNESVIDLELDDEGVFTTQIRRTAATLTVSSQGYETVQLENVQMIAADENGVIDLGTLSLGDRYATEYLSVEYTDAASMAIARYLVEQNVSVVLTAEDGTEYHGAGIRKVPGESDTADSYKFRILLTRDVSDYFALGQQVTLSYLDSAGCVIAPCTVTIARDGEQQALPLVLEKAPELTIKLSRHAHLFVFDEAGKCVYSGSTKSAKLLLEKGKYTVVAFTYNNYVSTIDSPAMLEQAGISDDLYIRETIDLTADTEKSYTVPNFNLRSEVGFSVTVGQNLRVGDLVPVQITYSDKYDEGAAEIAGLKLSIKSGREDYFVLTQVNGQYAFGTEDMRLSEEWYAGSYNSLVVTTYQPAGTITVYAKATGGKLYISGKNDLGRTIITLPGNDVEWTVPDTLGEEKGTLPLKAVLPEENQPYTANLYINGALHSQTTLQLKGLGENMIPYALEGFDDGVSTHTMQLEVLDKNGESVWISPAHMVMLTDAVDHPQPKILNIRTSFADDSGYREEKRFDLQSSNSGLNFTISSYKFNEDNTFNTDLVFDYRLTMSNYTQVKNDVVYMKVFCGKNSLEPTVTLVPLRLNPETCTFDGTFVMEANTCTGEDFPYGYSFEYATISPMKASINQAVGSVGGYMEELRDSYSENTFVYIDPDELEFNLDNCDSLTEEDKEVLRTLQAIENSLYTLRLQNEGRIQSAIAESYGPGAVDPTLSDAQKLAAVYEAAGGTVESVEGVSEADLLDMGYTAQTVEDNTVYMYTDEETGYVSVVDPVNGLHFYSGTPAVATFSGEALSDAQVEWLFLSILNSTKTLFDQVIDNLSGIRNYYNNTLATLLGCQGNVDSINKRIAYYSGYLAELKKTAPAEVLRYVEAGSETEKKILEIQSIQDHITAMQKKLKWAQGELSVAARCVSDQQARHRVVTKLNSVMNGWEAISNNPVFKGAFMVLDVRTVVLNVIDACSLYDVYESRAERIESTMDRADKAYRAMYRESLSECLANPEAAQKALEECREVYEEFIVACMEAQDWNRNWAVTHLVRMVTDDASIAMGYLAKSPQGMIASMAVGLVGLTGECIGVNMFNSYLDDINELYPDLNSACLDPLPFAKKDDCEEEDPNEDPDGSGEDEEEDEDDDSNQGLGIGASTDKEKPQYPIRTDPMIDPAGYVYEAVASNRIEGATAKIYYEGENGEVIYWSDADLYGEVNPQITDIDGRFAWMTPIGNWLVKITKDGYLDADSSNDPAAVDGWLPVPPPQLDVNIGLISTAAPTVVSAGVAPDQIRVVFSQYMDIAQVSGLVTVTQNGEPISVTVTFEDAEVSPANAGVYYGRIMKLTRTDGEKFSGDGIVVTIDKSAKNYAGNSLAGDYVSNSMEVDQLIGSLSHSYPNRYVTDVAQTEQIVVQVLDTNGKPMAGVTVTARQKVGGTLEMTESAVSDANGRAVFTVKGITSGYDTVIFDAGVVRTEMNTRVSPLGTTAPKKPTANLNDYAEVEKGTQLILTYPGADDVIIYYTTDNTCPCTDSDARKIYDGPITITEDTFFRIAAWTQAGGYSERLNLHITVKVDDHICKDHLTPVAESGATCTEDGYKAHYKCSCGKYFEDASASVEIPDIDAWKAGAGKIAKNGHNYTEQIKDAAHLKTAATKCTEYNIYWYACSVCDANAKDDPNAADKFYTSTEAGDHSFSEKLEDASHLVAGTGTDCQNAKKYYYDCAYCDEIGTTSWTSTTFGAHSFTEQIADDAHFVAGTGTDCQSAKKYYYDCAYCDEIGTTSWTSTTFGAHSFTEQIADDAHFVAGTGANCQDAKEYYYDCALCAEIGTISWVSTEMGDHEFDTTQWGYAEKETGHAHKCKYCTEHDTVQPHTPGAPATEDEDQICTVCLIVLVPKTGHICKNHLTPVAESGATCTEDGYKAHYKCSCGKYFEDATASIEIPDIDAWKAGDGKIAKNGHNYTEQIKDAAHLKTTATKCTEYNIYWYACSVCGANAKDDPNAADKFYTSTEAGEHSFSEKLEDASHLVAGTGTDCQNAKKYYYDCAYCDEIGTTSWTSTTFGAHSFIEQIADDAHFVAGTGANCQDAKEYYYDCALCAEIGTISWVSTEMGDHEFDTTQWGYAEKETGHAHKCKYCSEHDTVQPHTPGAPATEDEDQICTVCLIVLVPKTGHICKNHLTPVAESGATCTEDGYKAHYKCTCGKYFEDATASIEIPDIDAWKVGDGKIAKNGHNYTEQIKDAAHLKTAATKCTEYNIYWYACSVCGANAKDDPNAADKFYTSTEAGEHSFSEKLEDTSHLVAGTGTDCQSAKKYYYDCAYCDEIGTTIWTSTTFGAHSFTEQIADDAHFVAGTGANCQDAKEYYYDCALCAEIGTISWVSTEMGDHEFDTTQWGYAEKETGHAHKCKYCTEHDTVQPHTPGAPATEDEDQICTVCLIVLTPKTGHICNNHLTKVPAEGASCTVDGNIEYYTCSCGKWYSDATASVEITDKDSVKLPAGHNYGTLKPAQPEIHTATELKAGVAAHYHCSACGKYFTEGKVETTLEALTGTTPSHSYGDWKTDTDKHWKECSCGKKADEGNHVDANSNNKCDSCDKTLSSGVTPPPHTHDYGTTWKSDGTNHWKECSCGDKKEVTAHSGGTATCEAKAKCSECNTEYGELAEHKYSEATCTAKAKCSVCGDETGELAPHTPGADDGDCTTDITCSACGTVTAKGADAHTGGTATCTAKAKCSECGKEYGELAAHKYSQATCTAKAKCSVCGDETGELAPHDYVDGKCACGATDPNYQPPHEHNFIEGKCECGETDPNYTPGTDTPGTDVPGTDKPEDPDDGLSGGAIAGIVAGSVVVLVGGGFALWWFVFRKKKLF